MPSFETIKNTINKFAAVSVLILATATLILNVYYFIYQNQLTILSLSMMIYHFIFRNIFSYHLNRPQFIAFIFYMLFSFSILFIIYFSLRKVVWLGVILFILFILINIPLIDTNQLGL
jgi:hypothetical protein